MANNHMRFTLSPKTFLRLSLFIGGQVGYLLEPLLGWHQPPAPLLAAAHGIREAIWDSTILVTHAGSVIVRMAEIHLHLSVGPSRYGKAPPENLREGIALAVTARSPIERLLDFNKERGWKNLQILSDSESDYTRAYVSADDADVPGLTVFTRRDGTIRHFSSRAELRTSLPCGRSLTSHPQAAARPGTPSSNTLA